MRELGLDDVTKPQYEAASQTLVAMLRAAYPKLDLRLGTALRDLLVSPDASVQAWFSAVSEEQRQCSSLLRLSERSTSGQDVDASDVNAILSNFMAEAGSGTAAHGLVKIVVDAERTYTYDSDMSFYTSDGIQFTVEGSKTASPTPIAGQLQLYHYGELYYFTAPVVAVNIGSSGNIGQGVVLSPSRPLFGMVSCESYASFSGGTDIEPLDEVLARIPEALASRGLTTRTAAEARLRARFSSSDNPIRHVSVCGYGNAAQIRDRHNVMGVGVGGRADIYVRNFTAAYEVTVRKPSTQQEDGTYVVDVTPDDVPGLCHVRTVTPVPPEGSTVPAVSGVAFTQEFTSIGVATSGHDIDVSSGPEEAAGTVWSACRVRVSQTELSQEGDLDFLVTCVALPEATQLQDYIDDPTVMNVGLDTIVRCPRVCFVTVSAMLEVPYGSLFDESGAKQAVADYINGTGFPGTLSRSEIVSVLMAKGASRVLMPTTGMLSGSVYDASGKQHQLSGDSLNIADYAVPDALFTPDTVVFCSSPESISLNISVR